MIERDLAIYLHHVLSCCESRSDKLRLSPRGHNYILPTTNSLHLLFVNWTLIDLCLIVFCCVHCLQLWISLSVSSFVLPCFHLLHGVINCINMCLCHMIYRNSVQYNTIFLCHCTLKKAVAKWRGCDVVIEVKSNGCTAVCSGSREQCRICRRRFRPAGTVLHEAAETSRHLPETVHQHHADLAVPTSGRMFFATSSVNWP